MDRRDPDVPILPSGIDSLYVSFFIDGIGIDWGELAYLKEVARHERREFSTVKIGGLDWALLPAGRKPHPYILKRQDVTVSLAEHMRPRCLAQFHSQALWEEGPEKLVSGLRDWFRAVGTVEQAPERLSRVDWAFDAALEKPDFIANHVLGYARKDATWRNLGKEQTLQFGKGDTVARIYDKVAEIEEQSGKAWLFELWDQRENVWRVEFQVRRARLRATGIETMDDLRTFEGDLLHELSDRYTSLRVPTEDTNRSRWPLHPLWRAVRRAIGELAREGLARSFDPALPLAYAEDRAFKSIAGMMKNLAAVRTLQMGRPKPIDRPMFMEWLKRELLARIPHEIWEEEVRHRVEKRRFGL